MPQDPRIIDKEAREAWKVAPIRDLVGHIVARYHLETRIEMARLESYAEEAALLDGQNDPALLEIRTEVTRLGTEMRAHLMFEERETFPAILRLAETAALQEPATLLGPMKHLLMDEHEAEAALVRRIRALAEAYTPSQPAQATHLKLQAAIKALSENLQQHLFLENQILFQRVN